MLIKDLNPKTDKIHYMLSVIFENEDYANDTIEITEVGNPNYLDKHYVAELINADGDSTFDCTVKIDIGKNYAICHIMPHDNMCDESFSVFEYSQNIPMFREYIYTL